MDLTLLQDRVKRNPQGYREEFLQQVRHFVTNVHIYKLQPLVRAGKAQSNAGSVVNTGLSKPGASSSTPAAQTASSVAQSRRVKEFSQLISFLAHCAPLFPTEMNALKLHQELFTLYAGHCETLDPILRRSLSQAIILLTNKGILSRQEVYPALFNTFRCADKELRRSIFLHIVSDVTKLQKTSNHKLMGQLQTLVFKYLKDDHQQVAVKALQVLVELWKKNIWADDKTVNTIGAVCFEHADKDKLVTGALHFFLGEYDMAGDEDAREHEANTMKLKEIAIINSSIKHVKRKLKRMREVERAKRKVKLSEARLNGEVEDSDDENEKIKKSANLNPLSMIYDPQHFAERLFARLKQSKEAFSTRLLMMSCISKLIGMHKLLLFNFFPFMQRFLQPHQREITKILVYISRATHNLVPPEVLEPVVKTLAMHFVTDKSKPEVIAIGIGAIREICSRCPLVMNETLLSSLVLYAKHKNKGIMTAARSLIQVFRQLNPLLLHRRERGRDATLNLLLQDGPGEEAAEARALAQAKLQYGSQYVHRDFDGARLLAEAGLLHVDEKEGKKYDDDDEEWNTRHVDMDEDDKYLMITNALEDDVVKESAHQRKKRIAGMKKKVKQLAKINARRKEIGLPPMTMAEFKKEEEGGDDDEEEEGEEGDMDELDFDDLMQQAQDDEEDGEGDEDDENEDEDDDDDMIAMGDDDEEDGVLEGEEEDNIEEDFEGWEIDEDGEEDEDGSLEMMDGDDDEGLEGEDDEEEEEEEKKGEHKGQLKGKRPYSAISGPTKKVLVKEENQGKDMKGMSSSSTLKGKRTSSKQDSSSTSSQSSGVSKPSLPAAAVRLLTPADFQRIEELRKQRMLEGIKGQRKRQKELMSEDIIRQEHLLDTMQAGGYKDVNEDDLEVAVLKKRRLSKSERLASVLAVRAELREGRPKFGQRVKDDKLSKTHEESSRHKAFMMLKHSRKVQSKKVQKFNTKQKRTKEHIENLKRQKKNKHRKF